MVLGAALLLWQEPWQGDTDARVDIPADAASVLTQQFRALSTAGSESAFVDAAGPGSTAQAFATQSWAARTTLGATDVELRYLSGGEVADRADGSTEARVEVSWRSGDDSGLPGSSGRTSTVAFRISPPADGGTFSILSVRPIDGPLPLWLAGRITLERQPGSVVIRVDGGGEALPVEAMATAARTAVVDVVPSTTGDVTTVSPHTQSQMALIVGQDVAEIGQIAAVTTRLDGRNGGKGAGTVIVLNPAVFSTMDRRAAQVVMTHEATHLLTGAVGSNAASWVIEGFADFVALHDDTAPLSVSAGQALAEVKDGRGPTRLPTSADFGATRHGLGAVYESAWMAFRLLGQRNGDAAVVSFYEKVLQGRSLGPSIESSFDLSTRQLTADWRAYLTKSASTVS